MEQNFLYHFFSSIKLIDYLTVSAIIIGPIVAVFISRKTDDRSKERQRKVDIFRSLMKTRRNVLDLEHVGALNLIELEFYSEDKVTKCLHDYIDFRNSTLPPTNQEDGIRHAERGDALLYDLIQAVGQTINYNFDKHDLKRFSYTPQGWSDDNFLVRKNAEQIRLLLAGKISLPITILPPQQQSAFPPVPEELEQLPIQDT